MEEPGLRLLANALATVFGPGALTALLGGVSGAHFNPAVALAAWFTGRRAGGGRPVRVPRWASTRATLRP
ncbi:aquaporin [Streptomyces sp. NRRL F-5135]|uniref:aquaporin n=1 Tax=Streptomyces sp. NRRL F-5135 TaxID=1463858 RepID=UPI003B635D78